MISARHIGLRYDGGPEIVSDAHFDLAAGSFHYLRGPSGSGKTSLIRVLSMSLLPTRGELHVLGHNVQSIDSDARAGLRRRIGVIFQNYRLLPYLNVFDNIALPLRLAGINEAKIAPAVRDMAEWIGLGDYLSVRPAFLSGGQQQRAAIARAVIARPAILFADEPTGNLDDAMGLRIMALFEELNRSGTAILMATHNEGLIRRFPHPALTLNKGVVA